MPLQLDIFDEVTKKAGRNETDYVTMTLGGNDAGFTDVITTAVASTAYFNISGLSDTLKNTLRKLEPDGEIRNNLLQAYKDISDAAGDQAKIIVAGYPHLLDTDGSQVVFTALEAQMINDAISQFNLAIEEFVEISRGQGIDIHFVSVQGAFEGHGAYSDDPYIHPVYIGAKSEDLVDFTSWTEDDKGKTNLMIASAYSMHPNYNGACVYAACVQAKINELEQTKQENIDYSGELTYSKDLKVSVLNYAMDKCRNYKIIVEGKQNLALWGAVTKDYYEEITVRNKDTYPLELPKGSYKITVTDGVSSYSKKILTRAFADNDTLRFYTTFEYQLPSGDTSAPEVQQPVRTTSDERDIVLVLDTSGSMYGTPITELKEASYKFVSTILDEDASIGVVKYSGSATMVSDFSVSEGQLQDNISYLWADGNTNIEAGLKTAEEMLQNSNAKKKIIVLMSDGIPNRGKEGEDLISYADSIKAQGVSIYTLGFFEDLGTDLYSAQALMEGIASDGCHYEVEDADNLVFFFGDIADQINGQKYIYVRIACPVDVTVKHDGEKLCSVEGKESTRTSFGSLTFEENDEEAEDSSDNRVKVLRLREGEDYDIQIKGNGRGRMNYTIGFMDEDGEYSDLREFRNIKITKKTEIDTVAAVSKTTVLNVDEDGDGKYDLKYKAKENGRGKLVDYTYIIYIAVGVAAVALVAAAIVIIRKKTKEKRPKSDGSVPGMKFCGHCGARMDDTAKVCGQCGKPLDGGSGG